MQPVVLRAPPPESPLSHDFITRLPCPVAFLMKRA